MSRESRILVGMLVVTYSTAILGGVIVLTQLNQQKSTALRIRRAVLDRTL